MWVLAVIVGIAGAFGLLVGLSIVASIYALMFFLRIIVWIVLSAIALGRSYFAPPPPPSDGSYLR